MTGSGISAEFPFESRYVEVHGAKLHYIDEGLGEPILFLHGNPTSSYMWRNILPYLIPHGRCIALDLIGMGRSDKPDLDYRFIDHFQYVAAFIETLELTNITLVLHDWGSGLGFHYAAGNPENIKALAFMEAIVKPIRWQDFPLGPRIGFKLFRTPGIGWFMLSVMNMFLTQIMPQMTLRKLSETEKKRYFAPFPTVASRQPIRQWPCEIPADGKPEDMHELVAAFSRKLQESPVPKLLLYARPGAVLTAAGVAWCRDNLKNLKAVDIGKGLHYLPEDHPQRIGEELATWYQVL